MIDQYIICTSIGRGRKKVIERKTEGRDEQRSRDADRDSGREIDNKRHRDHGQRS